MCFPHIDNNGADVILLDRKNEFLNNNLTLCDDDCNFNRYDSENKRAICKYKIKYYIEEITNNIEIDSEKFFYGWKHFENIINIKVIKCARLLSTNDGFFKNIGNFMLLSIIILFIASIFYFYFKGFHKLTSEIMELKNDLVLNFNSKNNNNDKNIKPNKFEEKTVKKKKRKKPTQKEKNLPGFNN